MQRPLWVVCFALVAQVISGRTSAAEGLSKVFTVNGTVAWNTAKLYGFEFSPVAADSCEEVSTLTPRDGVKTVLRIKVGPCGTLFNFVTETVAEVVGGNMITYVATRNRSRTFLMYAKKRLSPGWKIKDVQVSSGTWIRQPAYGTSDMSFELRVTAYNDGSHAIVKSVVLEGPSTATTWVEAFKNAIAK